MRDLFRSYYRPTNEEFNGMWRDGIFSFDANVLLNVYRYTPETRNRLIEILKQINDRIWIPHQVAYEYHERRLDVIFDQFKASESIEKQLDKSLQDIKNELRQHKTHSFANTDQLSKIIREAIEQAKNLLKRGKDNHPDFFKQDSLLETITNLFENKVGQPYSDADLENFYKEAEQRFKQKIPPGFEDRGKEGPKKYGDVLVWYQLIDHMKAEKRSLIFITGDRKEDWWLRHNGKTVGPRRELIQEMFSKAGVPFYMYLTDQFIEQAENFLNLNDQQDAIEEIREIRRQDEAKHLYQAILKRQFSFSEKDVEKSLSDLIEEKAYYVAIVNKYWIDITDMTKELIEKDILPNRDKNNRLYNTPSSFIRELARNGLISENIFSMFEYLRLVRNKVVHEGLSKDDFSQEKSLKFLDAASSVSNALSLLIVDDEEI